MQQIFKKAFGNVEKLQDGAYYFHLAKGEIDTKMHMHSKGQFVYAEGGYLYIEIDTKIWFLPARHYMWIPALVPHRIWSESTIVRMYTIYFSLKKREADFYNKVGIYYVSDLLREMILYTKSWDGYVGAKDNSKYIFSMAIKAILPETHTEDRSLIQFTMPIPKDERLLQIKNYIEKNLEEAIAIDSLARRFGMGGRTLSRLFKQDLGMSYIQFLKVIRLIRAFELLVENKSSIKEIAFKLGYSSVPTFSNTFYDATGIRPTHYTAIQKH